MAKRAELTGKRFGRLVVTGYAGRNHRGGSLWFAKCDCGTVDHVTLGAYMTCGDTTSCGCKHADDMARIGERRATHGAKRQGQVSREYGAWQSMKDRCLNANCSHFADYGGRGITVCAEWRDDFAAFLDHMGPRPSGRNTRYTIDRIDVNGNYEPGNVRWATDVEQARNRRSNRPVTWRGRTMLMVEWSEEIGCDFGALKYRLDAGWDVEYALTKPFASRPPDGLPFETDVDRAVLALISTGGKHSAASIRALFAGQSVNDWNVDGALRRLIRRNLIVRWKAGRESVYELAPCAGSREDGAA